MKEFLQNNKVTYNLMSFTAFKSLLLFSYLLEQPRSYEEIREYFANHEYLNETISIDTLRVYINSLERIGCIIRRGRKADGSKYHLEKHPIELSIDDEYVKSLIKVYKIIAKSIDIEELLYLFKFFKKLAKVVKNEKLREVLEGLSPLSKIDLDIFMVLLKACRRHEEVSITYLSPASGLREIDVLAQKLLVSNNKVYLQGVSPGYKGNARFLLSRITAIPVVKLERTIDLSDDVCVVGCEIYYNLFEPLENEKIISHDGEKYTIEIDCKNRFLTRQRLLSFGSDCRIIYPQDFKNEFVSILKKMKDEYVTEKI